MEIALHLPLRTDGDMPVCFNIASTETSPDEASVPTTVTSAPITEGSGISLHGIQTGMLDARAECPNRVDAVEKVLLRSHAEFSCVLSPITYISSIRGDSENPGNLAQTALRGTRTVSDCTSTSRKNSNKSCRSFGRRPRARGVSAEDINRQNRNEPQSQKSAAC